ncbi:hypothetical protein E2C01_091446 [Portunus trituberculatus]|uniref:Uncharacterized protein n=1 Tax=Portunus trituberculatus TaxID=210409 RepID=A0A5B7JV21_PORTR|nr:hypothetical protein [Portunus trituberculatus]
MADADHVVVMVVVLVVAVAAAAVRKAKPAIGRRRQVQIYHLISHFVHEHGYVHPLKANQTPHDSE